jgi:RNA ligase
MNNPDLREVIPNHGLLMEMLTKGYIRKQEHPTEPLFILNYTEKATYDQVWNQATRTCRGLIVRSDTFEVEARPFPKFFNWNEPNAPKIDPSEPVWVTDKMDGSLGIRYWCPNAQKWAIATRGSFTSEQAVHATQRLDDYYHGVHNLNDDDYELTQLFEIIYPENRIVLQYGDLDMLVALGAVRKRTGRVFPRVSDPAFEQPLYFSEANTYADALAAKPRPNAEGIVVVTSGLDDQRMVKIKQSDYVELHKTITGLNDRVIWERLRLGDDAEDIKRGVPEEFWDYIDRVSSDLYNQTWELENMVTVAYVRIIDRLAREHGIGWTRKQFAEVASKLVYRDLLFLLLDGRPIHDVLWKKVKPSAENGPLRRNNEED